MKQVLRILSIVIAFLVILTVLAHAFLGTRLGQLQSLLSFGLLFVIIVYLGWLLVLRYQERKLQRVRSAEGVIFEILSGVASTSDLNQLLLKIHTAIGRKLNAENCFVALANEKTGLMEMQFFLDKNDQVPQAFPPTSGLTGYVYHEGSPVLLKSEQIAALIESGRVQAKGTQPAIWMGVPLKSRNKVIGVVVVQDYSNANAYRRSDLELLAMVGDQIALAIERKRYEESIRASEEQHRLLFDSNPQPAYVYDLESLKFLAVNQAAINYYGFTRDDFLDSLTLCSIRPEEDIPTFLDRVSKVKPQSDTILAPSRHMKSDGSVCDVEITSRSIIFAERSAEIVLVNDVTERLRNEAITRELSLKVAKERLRFHTTLENVPCVIWEVPLDPSCPKAPAPFVNGQIERMFGYTPEEWLGTPDFWHFTIYPEDQSVIRLGHEELLEKGEVTLQSRWNTKNGSIIWGETRMVTVNDESGKVVGLRGLTSDITDRKVLENQLTYQALHDPLTGLPNRVLFRDRVEHALELARRSGNSIAVMLLDLDNFKAVNDTLGHAAGDELLSAVTERLLACLRSSDTAARLGGDEFAVLVEETAHTDGAVLIAERIRTILAEPYRIHGAEVFVGTSIGIATSTDNVSSDELVRNADVAMYRSKAEGRNRYTTYESDMHDSIIKRVQTETDLRMALERGEIEVYYQPIVDLQTERVVGMEALSRWNHSQRGLISPIDFIPIAEESGLIVPIGAWVLEQACVQARKWQETFDRDLSITVNISSRQFQGDDLYKAVKFALELSKLAPHTLVLEITESTMLRDTDATIGKLRSLKSLGVRLAVDDFGTGYSSLSYLQRFPVDILKIDKSFVDQIGSGSEGSAVAKAIITMGDTLRLKTIAEGIEHPNQTSELIDLGCMLGQGFHFAKPLDMAGMDECLRVAFHGESIESAFLAEAFQARGARPRALTFRYNVD